jgi:hypothetical protein
LVTRQVVTDISEKDFVSSETHLEDVIVRSLKLAHSPARYPREGWKQSVPKARRELDRRRSPAVEAALAVGLPKLFASARRHAERDLRRWHEDDAARELPDECPWTLRQLPDAGFWP